MRKKHRHVLNALFAQPVRANIRWNDIEGLFRELGAEISERQGSRVAVVLYR